MMPNIEIYKSEIRDSTIRDLIEKVRKQNYGQYLSGLRLEKIRFFRDVQIKFDFPVTALIGTNGSGKSTILNACGCAYSLSMPKDMFRKSRIGDQSMDDWVVEYDILNRETNPSGIIRSKLTFNKNEWLSSHNIARTVKYFGVTRTVPATSNPDFKLRRRLSIHKSPRGKQEIATKEISDELSIIIKQEAERILGKSFSGLRFLEISLQVTKTKVKKNARKEIEQLPDGSVKTTSWHQLVPEKIERKSFITQTMYVNQDEEAVFSEFNFGSGESSVIRMVADIEKLPNNSLVLIEEIENGLHPIAVCRLVDYLMSVAKRKNIQIIFTTHSDYALACLPSEAIWASIDGHLQQGKLSVEALRAISGSVDKQIAIFVEDDFAKLWLTHILREEPNLSDLVGVYSVSGDGNAVNIHLAHVANPSISFNSLCFIDGDSRQTEDSERGIYRLPGTMPEATIFNYGVENLTESLALLTAACQRPANRQNDVGLAIKEVSRTNRDPHLLFNQVGIKIGLVPESIVAGAFLMLWTQNNPTIVSDIIRQIKVALEKEKSRKIA